MSEQKGLKRVQEKKPAKEYNELEIKLKDALSDWKEKLGEKKFDKRIKRAVKAFGKNLKLNPPKKAAAPRKKLVKKTAKPAAKSK